MQFGFVTRNEMQSEIDAPQFTSMWSAENVVAIRCSSTFLSRSSAFRSRAKIWLMHKKLRWQAVKRCIRILLRWFFYRCRVLANASSFPLLSHLTFSCFLPMQNMHQAALSRNKSIYRKMRLCKMREAERETATFLSWLFTSDCMDDLSFGSNENRLDNITTIEWKASAKRCLCRLTGWLLWCHNKLNAMCAHICHNSIEEPNTINWWNWKEKIICQMESANVVCAHFDYAEAIIILRAVDAIWQTTLIDDQTAE